jgi:hypothetical protein
MEEERYREDDQFFPAVVGSLFILLKFLFPVADPAHQYGSADVCFMI